METYCLLHLLWVTPATKSTKFGSRYLGEWSSEWDKILRVATGGAHVSHHPDGDLWPRGVKKFL